MVVFVNNCEVVISSTKILFNRDGSERFVYNQQNLFWIFITTIQFIEYIYHSTGIQSIELEDK